MCIMDDVAIEYTVDENGKYVIKVPRCHRKVKKSDDPQRDILAYVSYNTDGVNLASLCRHTGHSRHRVKNIVSKLSDAGKVYVERIERKDHSKTFTVYPVSA